LDGTPEEELRDPEAEALMALMDGTYLGTGDGGDGDAARTLVRPRDSFIHSSLIYGTVFGLGLA